MVVQLSHIRYHGVFLWNGVIGDWSSVDTWFGTCCAPGVRMQARGLVYRLFVAQNTWFGIPDVCSARGALYRSHEIRDHNSV